MTGTLYVNYRATLVGEIVYISTLKLITQLLNAMPTFLKEFLIRSHFVATKKILYKVNPINFLDYALDFLVKWYISPKQSMANPPKNTS